jgi:hypothetical protein
MRRDLQGGYDVVFEEAASPWLRAGVDSTLVCGPRATVGIFPRREHNTCCIENNDAVFNR